MVFQPFQFHQQLLPSFIPTIQLTSAYLISLGIYEGFENILNIVLLYHERLSGYPIGQAGKELSLNVRIMGIVDTYDAMVTTRSYRDGVGTEAALDELEWCAGSLYDEELVHEFIGAVKRGRVDNRKGIKKK